MEKQHFYRRNALTHKVLVQLTESQLIKIVNI